MDAIECIKTRRSIRKFKPDTVPRKAIMEIIDCGRHAPSSRCSQPWQFVVVTDDKTKQELAALKGQRPGGWMESAPAFIAVCTGLSLSKRWVEDGSIAAENMLLAAHALGLGACWVAMRYEDTARNARIQKALGVSENIFPICLIALGYPAEEPEPKQLKGIHSMVR